LARCWALSAELKAVRCRHDAGRGHWFCHQHRIWPLKILLGFLGTFVIAGIFVPSVHSYLWGLIAPPTRLERDNAAHVENIETGVKNIEADIKHLLDNKDTNPQALQDYIDQEGFKKEYPFGYALFYSDRIQTVRFTTLNIPNVDFGPSDMKVTSISLLRGMCLSKLMIFVQGWKVEWTHGVCLSTSPRHPILVRFTQTFPQVTATISPLASGASGAALIIRCGQLSSTPYRNFKNGSSLWKRRRIPI
jgi:hypothetical protein